MSAAIAPGIGGATSPAIPDDDAANSTGAGAHDPQTAQVIRYLQTANVPDGSNPRRYRDTIDFALGRYRRGLSRYIDNFERMGFGGAARGLDVGCGVGQWVFAFLTHGQEAIGIDRKPECVGIAVELAKQLDLASRSRFLNQTAEKMQLPVEAVDCAWAAGVLQYTDVERVLARVAALLEPSGQFYCGYDNLLGRYLDIADGLESGETSGPVVRGGQGTAARANLPSAERQLNVVVGAALHDCGVYVTPRSHARNLGIADLLRVCRIYGLTYVARPGVLDTVPDYGFDFVVRKIGGPEDCRNALLAGTPIEKDWIANLETIARSGAPFFVADVIRTTEPDLADPTLRDLFARAMIRAGKASEEPVRQMFEDPAPGRALSALAMGLYWHDRGNADRALGHYRTLADEHPDKYFLIVCCLLERREWEAARSAFRHAIDDGKGMVRCGLGIVSTRLRAGDYAGAWQDFQCLSERLPPINDTAGMRQVAPG